MHWYIERIPAAGGSPETRTLDAWGIDSSTITALCWGLGGADLVLPSGDAGTTAPAWADGDHLVVWAGNPAAGGTRRAHLWVLMPGTHADPQAESHQYRLVDPWYWLEQTQFFYPLTISDITTDPETGAATGCTWHMRHGTEVVWTNWADQSSGTIKGQLHRALYCAIDNDAPIAIGAIDIPGLAPVLEQLGLTCADVIARAARCSPRASQWWDMSGSTPIFRAASLASRPALTLALGPDSQSWDIAPRHDLRIDVVRVGYQWDNNGATAAWYDTAGDDTLKDGAHTLRSLVDCPDSVTASNAASHYGIAAQLYAALHSTPYTGTLAWWGAATGALTVHPGHALNLTGSLAAYETMAAPIASVALTITSANEDTVQVSLGLPDTLGANDLFAVYNLGRNLATGAADTTGGTTEPSDPADGSTIPGTLSDLNGTSTGGGEPGGSIPVQSRGGNWAKIGFSEYTPDSGSADPSRRYLTLTGSGSILVSSPTLLCSDLWATTGASRYAPATGQIVESMHYTLAGVDQGVRISGEYQGAVPSCCSGYMSYHAEWTRTVLTEYVTVVDHSLSCAASGQHLCTLSNEDTEDSARDRMLATAEWSGGATTAIRTVPTTGITGIWRKIRYRTEHTAAASTAHWVFGAWVDGVWVPGHEVTVSEPTVYPTLTGLAIWSRYRLRIVLQKRPVDAAGVGAGDYVTGETIYSAPFSTDINGEGGVDWAEIEPEAGYETAIQSAIPELY